MFPPSATLVLLAVVGCCTYSVGAVHHVDITVLPDADTPISMTSDQNVTYNCSISEGNVVWQVNEYQLIDRDEFSAQDILIQEHEDGDFSQIIMKPDGYRFLRGQFGTTSFNLQCLAVVDDVNVMRGETQAIAVYDGVGDGVRNLRANTGSDGVTNVTWDRPDVDDLVPITYNVTVTNSDQLHETTTDDTQVVLPRDVECDVCEITVTAANDAGSTSTSLRTSIPTSPSIESIAVSFQCNGAQEAVITVTYSFSDDQHNNSTVTFYTSAGMPSSIVVPTGNKENEVMETFSDPNCDDIYSVQVSACTDSYCRDFETLSITRALRCRVTYFRTNICHMCSFSPGTESSPWGVQFVFTINNERPSFNLTRSQVQSGYPLDQNVAGDIVVAYMWHPENGLDTQPITTDVVMVDDEDDFPCDVPTVTLTDDGDDEVCGTTCIIIVIVVGVVCLVLGALFGVVLGWLLHKYCSSKGGKRRVDAELSETTKHLYDTTKT